ncbi:fatty-acid amide hydrolase 2 isoform X2 [Neodiprion fabricii]|uniref:fatty-acid amide hydrolase 2 isoform X2 n=1 Tax=Neodiprion fabricii TaxID=2872261 RepID=UPI001ED8EE21|nr:fatty-acid amide hydrolase 2 isoform X2 [Neodiprion fabricii]
MSTHDLWLCSKSHQYVNYSYQLRYLAIRQLFTEMLNAVTKRIIRGLLFCLYCLMSPVILYRALGSRKRCSLVRNKLLLLSATDLARKIREQQITSEEVVTAYITRCRDVNPVINAIVETRYDLAIQEAREADKMIRLGHKSLDEIARDTPLLGIPITVKGSIAVQGMNHAAGRKWPEIPRALCDADAVQRVREAGGIVLLVSNTPELCMCWETYNNVTGMTVNPYDTRRTAGGSSGGEAALLGSAASLLSLSSDIGGSARLPAMFCGIFGHKPTPGFVSTNGHMPGSNDKAWPNFFTLGPMVRYAEDLPLLLKAMCQSSGSKLKLDNKVPLRDIKFFYMEDDCGSGATSSIDRDIKRAIRRLIEHLNSLQGVMVQKAELTDMKYSFEVMAAILLHIDGVESIYSKKSNPQEWKSVTVEILKYLCRMSPHTFPSILYGVLKKVNNATPQTYFKMVEKNAAIKKQFADLLGDNGVLIYPTFVSAAHYPYEIYHKVCNVSYLAIFNSLGLPVTQCPLGFNRNGLPIGVQIVANPGCDHLTLSVAREIERAFGGWQQPTTGEKV